MMTRFALQERVRAAVAADTASILRVSHDLHDDPEIRWQEHRSVDLLGDALRTHGFEVEVGVGGLETAFRATCGAGSRRVAFIAEYDALEGLGHACGHNVIAASAVGAGWALACVADALDVCVEVIGTPAEEGGGGKILMQIGRAHV